MVSRDHKPEKNKSRSAASKVSARQPGGGYSFPFVDMRPQAIAQRRLQEIAASGFSAKKAAQMQAIAENNNADVQKHRVSPEHANISQQQESNEAPIQRKIGFEFEYSNWQTVEASAAHFATATSTVPFANSNDPNWRRIPKGKALVRGNGFELQADDDPNDATKSDLEIVTDAFDESVSGRGQIRDAMHAIQGTLGHITNNFNNWWTAGHLPRAIDIPGTTVRSRSFLYALMPHWNAKPQTTIGLSLDKVADLLEDTFAVALETGAEAAARRQGRMELTGWDPNAIAAGPILQVQGRAPTQARLAIINYRINNPAAPPKSEELVGLLSLIVAYLRMADQALVRSYAKTIAPVMARTDFAALFKMLSPAERNWYKANGGQPLFDLVRSAPWLAGMVNGDEVFAQGVQNPVLGVGQAQGLTRGMWITGIANGTDYLTGKKFPDKTQRKDIEGLGAYGKKTDQIILPGGLSKQAAILELRSMPTTSLANIADVADRIWLYTYLANRGGNEKYGQVQAQF